MFRVSGFIFLAALLGLTGCRLISDEPVFDHADGQPVYGPEFAMVSLDDDGLIALDKNVQPSMLGFLLRDGAYVTDHDEPMTLSFHALEDRDPVMLAQLSLRDEVLYAVARVEPERLRARSIAVPDRLREALVELGYSVAEAGSDTRVSDRESLMAATEAFIRTQKLMAAEAFDEALNYRIATNEAQAVALVADVAAAMCLAMAGHPYDPAIKGITEKFRTGRWMDDIDAKRAGVACENAAQASGASPSVRYAHARTLLVAGDHAASLAIAEELRRADFPLAYVFIADAMLKGNGVPADPTEARRVMDSGSHHAVVRHNLALWLKAGSFGGEPDLRATANLLRSAVKEGFVPARVELGLG